MIDPHFPFFETTAAAQDVIDFGICDDAAILILFGFGHIKTRNSSIHAIDRFDLLIGAGQTEFFGQSFRNETVTDSSWQGFFDERIG
ncbi:MAG: hypothetical protein IJ412_00100 [Oscillospiraceae bacterium]|nr:hypothetical protein [Oscillospiraceae bacterium]